MNHDLLFRLALVRQRQFQQEADRDRRTCCAPKPRVFLPRAGLTPTEASVCLGC